MDKAAKSDSLIKAPPMHLPDTALDALREVMRQAEVDLSASHAEICKLSGLDPATHDWPVWSSPRHTRAWFAAIREKFGIDPVK